MKKLIKRLIVFIIIILTPYTLSFYYLRMILRNQIESSSIIIIGDSHTQNIHIKDTFNRSISGSPYFIHYFFCKDFIEQLQGKKIYIAYSFHNLSKSYQNRMLNDQLLLNYRNKMLDHIDDFNLINWKHDDIATRNGVNIIDVKKISNFFNAQHSKENDTIQSEEKLCDKTHLSIASVANRHFSDPRYILNDNIQHHYLKLLTDLLIDNNCKVELLLTPLTEEYKTIVPAEIKSKFYEFANSHEYSILDLDSTLSISSHCEYFKDYDHVNKFGNLLIEKYLISLNKLEQL